MYILIYTYNIQHFIANTSPIAVKGKKKGTTLLHLQRRFVTLTVTKKPHCALFSINKLPSLLYIEAAQMLRNKQLFNY